MDITLIRQNIVRARKSLNLTQVEMAYIIGISRQSYCNLENGKTAVINKQIIKMSEQCGLPLELILFGLLRESLSEDSEMIITELREKVECLIQLIRENNH